MTSNLLDGLYQSAYKKQIESLLKQAKVFGVSVFGDGATIKKVPLMNFLASSPNNPCALLEIVDCTSEMASGGKKSAQYICGLIKPIISRIEMTKSSQFSNHTGVVDLLLFDGAAMFKKQHNWYLLPIPESLSFMEPSMLFLYSSRMSSPKFRHSKDCLIFLSGAGTSLDQRIMVLMPYSRIIRCFITRTSILVL